jgi:hypothetical protein
MEGFHHQALGELIGFDEIDILVSILDDAIVFVHLFERRDSQVEHLDILVKPIFDDNSFAIIFGDIQ